MIQCRAVVTMRNGPSWFSPTGPLPPSVYSASCVRIGHDKRAAAGKLATVAQPCGYPVKMDCLHHALVGIASSVTSQLKADVGKKKRVPGDQPIAWPKAEEAPATRIWLGVFPVQRLHACVNALTS
jgi:hypothetical protein